MSKKSDYELARQAELIEDAWLGLDKTSDEIFNPLENIPDEYIEDPQMYILWLLSQPEYFTLICKYVLKIELYPFQLMILRELWTKKFPILIGCRGLSKTYTLAVYCILRMMLMPGRKIVLTGAVFRQSKLIFEYMERIWNNAPILRDLYGDSKVNGPHHENDAWKFVLGESITYALPVGDGCLTKVCLITTSNGISNIDLGNSTGVVQHDKQVWSSADKKFVYSDQSYNNGIQKTKKITTKRGYSIEGTHNHKLKVFRNNEVVWSRLDEMVVGDRILIDRSERWFQINSDVTESQAYALGLMIGDGCWTDKYHLSFATKDIELVDKLRDGTNLPWKQHSDFVHFKTYGVEQVGQWLNHWGLERCYTIDKYIPNKILSSSKNAVAALISGLYDTDGHIQVNRAKGGVGICVGFTNTSEKLVDQLQYLLLHFGIISTKSSRTRDNLNWNRVYELLIHGKNVRLFYEKINFRLERKRLTLEQALKEKIRDVCNGDEIPDVKELMIECTTSFVDKTIPVELRAKVCLSKIRQKKSITHSYLETFLDVNKNNPHRNISILKGLLDADIYYDTISSIEDGEECTYDIHVPDTHEYCANGFFSHNSTIRGYRAHDIICDEFASINVEIFEHVIKGFAMVSADPISNSKRLARIKKSIELGVKTEEVNEANYSSNQVVLSGTAYYEFNHFYKYWKRYKNIILANNNKKKLIELGEDPTVDSDDYGIIRIPYDLLPEGLMDKDIIASAKGNLHSSLYSMEVLACFSSDSNGFFKRSLLEKCLGDFPISLQGEKGKQYVLGIDPASETDNFCIVLVEVTKNVRKICYSWTSTKQSYKEELKSGKAKENDFYDYVCRKILNLCNTFNIVGIAIDTQGGGHAIIGRLHNPSIIKIENGETALWPIIDPDKPSEDDIAEGRHIIHPINFADSEWTSSANHSLRLEFESRTILFPKFDELTFAEIDLSSLDDLARSDITEEAVMEIEEMKNELSSIVMTQTASGRDRWDTPDQKLPGSKKGRMRKDRYSALLMAAYLGRKLVEEKRAVNYSSDGGVAQKINADKIEPVGFIGGSAIGAKLAKQLTDLYS